MSLCFYCVWRQEVHVCYVLPLIIKAPSIPVKFVLNNKKKLLISCNFSQDNGSFYVTPSPPGSGRPPSGSYRHKTRDSSSANSKENRRKVSYKTGSDYSEYPYNNSHHSSAPKFCQDCGNKFCRSDAKFCCECGMRRLQL